MKTPLRDNVLYGAISRPAEKRSALVIMVEQRTEEETIVNVNRWKHRCRRSVIRGIYGDVQARAGWQTCSSTNERRNVFLDN